MFVGVVSRRVGPLVLAVAMVLTVSGPATAAGLTPIKVPDVAPNVVFEGSGWGHSVGMSQYGAYAMAKAGWGYERILKHYYSDQITLPDAGNPGVRVNLSENTTGGGCPGGQPCEQITLTSDSPNSVPWRLCGNDGCQKKITQQPGEAFLVFRWQDWWRIHRDVPACESDPENTAGCQWKGKLSSGQRWAVPFGSGKYGTQSGKVVAPNANGGTRTYAYGRLELYPNASKDDGQVIVNRLSVEHYLRGLGEMPSGWGTPENGGMEALKSQVVAARTYAHRRVGSNWYAKTCKCDLLSTPQDQVFAGYSKELEWGSAYWVAAVRETAGRVANHNGSLIQAYYSSSHGGESENSEDSWAFRGSSLPYLRSVDDSWSARAAVNNPYRTWICTTSNKTFANYVGHQRVLRVHHVGGRTDGGTPNALRIQPDSGSIFDWTGERGLAGASLRYEKPRGTGVAVTCNVGPSGTRALPSQQLKRVGLAPFRDDDGSSHETNIARIAAAGLTQSCNSASGGDRYCPDRKLTRAEMATFLMRAFEEIEPAAGTRFSDTPLGATHTSAISAIYDAGLTQGCGGTKYCPDRYVTRAEMATFLVRAIDGLDPVEGETRFSDVKIGSTHAAAITAIADAGITQGCGGTKFCPDRAVTRGEMASFLVRALTWKP